MTDILDEIPNTDDFWLNIEGGPHFDVSAYLNARDEWVEKLKKEWHQKHLKATAWERSKEQYFDNKTKLKSLKEGLPNLTALDISIRDAEYILKVLTVVRHEVRGLATR